MRLMFHTKLNPFFHGAALARWVKQFGTFQRYGVLVVRRRELKNHCVLEQANECLVVDFISFLSKHLRADSIVYCVAYLVKLCFCVTHCEPPLKYTRTGNQLCVQLILQTEQIHKKPKGAGVIRRLWKPVAEGR